MATTVETAPRRPSRVLRFRIARALDIGVLSMALVAAFFLVAARVAPELNADMPHDAMSADGGQAYVFSPGFALRWPYLVPSHPDSVLAPGDVQLTENGQPIGTLEPSHDVIRHLGGGRYNMWEGNLWFSASDGTDPRANGRSYTLRVRSRLAPSAVAVGTWSVAALAALILCRAGLAVQPGVSRWSTRVRRRLALGRRLRAGWASTVRHLDNSAAFVRRAARWIPLTFGRSFALVSGVLLGGFVWQTLERPMPLFTQPDSYGYILPGLAWAAGVNMAGQSTRDLGYPVLTVLAVRLGSLADLAPLQLFIVVAGLICVLAALYVTFVVLASRLGRVAGVPRWPVAVAAASAATAYIVLMARHDLFVVDIYSAMAEGPHVLPTALALLLFLGGWMVRAPGRRIVLLALASIAAYMSVMVKPHTSVVMAMCVASLIVVGLRHYRALRSPLVLAVCLATVVSALAIHRLDVYVTPPNSDFGPKVLFCNHLDVAAPVFDTSTPERQRIMALMREALGKVNGWPLMGYSGDACIYNPAFTDAIIAAARSEGLPPTRWEDREFLKAVLRNPLGYLRDIANQTRYFLLNPMANDDFAAASSVNDADWKVLQPYAGLINMQRSQLDVQVSNWVPNAYPRLAALAKRMLQTISDVFAPVTLGSTGLALIAMIVFRKKADLRLEIALVATACFVAAFVATTALSHSFDVGRYVVDIMPFSLLWWLVGTAYLGHVLVVVGAVSVRRFRRPRPAIP